MKRASKQGNQLILMRHAKSEWYSGVADDFLRPLAPRGSEDARLMGQWLVGTDYCPATVLCSTAVRTRATLDLLLPALEQKRTPVTVFEQAIYHSSVDTIVTALGDLGQAEDVMVLGHNPGLEDLLYWLVADRLRSDFDKVFPTAGLYVLACKRPLDDLAAGCAQVVAHQRPKRLR